MTTLTDLTNKMKSVGKGLQRTSAFPIDKWQLWDSFNDSNTKLIYVDPTTNTSTECDTPDELANLVAQSIIAYPGFTFSVVDTDRTSHNYTVYEISSYSPTQVNDNKTRVLLNRQAIKLQDSLTDADILNDFSDNIANPNIIEKSLYSVEYNQWYEPNISYNDSIGGFIFKPWLLDKYGTVDNSDIENTDLSGYYPLVMPLYSVTLHEKTNDTSSPTNVYLSVFEANGDFEFTNGRAENLDVYTYTYLGSSDTSARFDGSGSEEPHEFTFTKCPIVLDNTKRYVMTFTSTNSNINTITDNLVNVGVRTRDCWGPLVKSIVFNPQRYYQNNRFPIVKLKVIKSLGSSEAYILNNTFTKLHSPNTFTKLNTFSNGLDSSNISSVNININSDNNVSSIYSIKHSYSNNWGNNLYIGSTAPSGGNIVIDTYPGHADNALSVIQYGSTRYIGNNSRASYSVPLPLSSDDNTLATTQFTKSHINSVSSALNTIISTTSSDVTGIVNTVSSFISGEVSNLSSKVINDVSSVSSAIDSKIIMRIWN